MAGFVRGGCETCSACAEVRRCPDGCVTWVEVGPDALELQQVLEAAEPARCSCHVVWWLHVGAVAGLLLLPRAPTWNTSSGTLRQSSAVMALTAPGPYKHSGA